MFTSQTLLSIQPLQLYESRRMTVPDLTLARSTRSKGYVAYSLSPSPSLDMTYYEREKER